MSQAKTSNAKPEWPTAFANPFELLVPLQRAHLEAMTKATQTFFDGLMSINREMMAFADERARAFGEGAKPPSGGQPMELWSQQLDRATSATQAYMQEAGKLFELGMKVSQESWAPLQESMTSALNNGSQRKAD